ncbi:MAG: ABC transporter permease subunit [Streptosporangiales bacterium]|nr:ABC transporter permease subunit [Streptosporangiales bacterium]
MADTHGLLLEVAPREMTGPPVPGAPRRRTNRYLLGLPAAVLLGLLLAPTLWTVWLALRTDDGVGLGNFVAVVTDPEAVRAGANSLTWVVMAICLLGLGLGIALLSRRVERLWGVLLYVMVLPFGISLLVSGAAFRMIFDPTPEHGIASAAAERLTGSSPVWLGTGSIRFVLVSAFAWTWLGYVVSLFRAGLDAIPVDVIRTARAEGLSRLSRLRHLELPILRPVTAIVVLTLIVAAARLFDLILIVTPGSSQDEVDVVALRWWHMVTSSPDPGRPAALAVLLSVFVVGVALVGMRGMRRPWAIPEYPADGEAAKHRYSGRLERSASWIVGFVVAVMWAFPLLVLAATAWHEPAQAGAGGWWRFEGLGAESFVEAANVGLWRSLFGTAVIAVLATALVLTAAVPAAYLLAWGGLPRWLGRSLVVLFVMLAVLPVQMYAGPLGDVVDTLGLGGSRIPLIFVHAAAGLPFAMLVLRPAFASAPPDLAAAVVLGRTGQRAAFGSVWRRRRYRPALVAVAVLEFVLVWNDFIVGFLISGPGSSPLTLLLWGEARQFAASAGTVAASAVVASLVPAVVLLTTWKRVIRGLTGGALR